MKSGLVNKVRVAYPELRFVQGTRFAFRPPRTVVIGPEEQGCDLQLLHEVGHAILKHRDFRLDIERLKMEMAAWEKARELAIQFGVTVDEELIQGKLDTYRDWLYQKSRCPKCGLTRYQTTDKNYRCPGCEALN